MAGVKFTFLGNSPANRQSRPPVDRNGLLACDFKGPGPASVVLPTLTGQRDHDSRRRRAPAYSFGILHRGQCGTKTPGPAAYNTAGTATNCSRTFGSRGCHINPAPQTSRRIPATSVEKGEILGPSSFNPNYRVSKNAAPRYSLGNKHRPFPGPDTPAPDSYTLPAMLSMKVKIGGKVRAPKYSFGAQHPQPIIPQVPGPGAYEAVHANTCRRAAPSYSMVGQNAPRWQHFSPGPAAHSAHIHDSRGPAFSFGVRHTRYKFEPFTEE